MDLSQPNPIPTENKPLWDSVIDKMLASGAYMGSDVINDMQDRDRVGRQTYGVPLTAHNGRDALKDAYAELLDAVVYLEQYIVESDDPVAPYWQHGLLEMICNVRRRLARQEMQRAAHESYRPNSA